MNQLNDHNHRSFRQRTLIFLFGNWNQLDGKEHLRILRRVNFYVGLALGTFVLLYELFNGADWERIFLFFIASTLFFWFGIWNRTRPLRKKYRSFIEENKTSTEIDEQLKAEHLELMTKMSKDKYKIRGIGLVLSLSGVGLIVLAIVDQDLNGDIPFLIIAAFIFVVGFSTLYISVRNEMKKKQAEKN